MNEEQQATEDDVYDQYDGDWSRGQFLTFMLLMICSSLFSLCGSLTIIRQVLRDLSKVYHRTLLMLSLSDIVFSFSNMLSMLLAPPSKTNNPFSIGNDASCAAMAFTTNASLIAVSVYSSFISANFLLQIRYQWTNEQVAKSIERCIHVAAILMSFPLPILGVISNTMAPERLTGVCLMVEYPNDCHLRDDVECINGGDAIGGLLATITAGMLYITGFIGFGCTFGLYWTVRSTIKRSDRFRFSRELSSKQKDRLRQVSWQCSMYALAYLNTIMWPAINQIAGRSWDIPEQLGDTGPFVIMMLSFWFMPFQGALNFLIFVTPRYQRWRKALPEEPWMYVLQCTLSADDPPTRFTADTNAVSTDHGGGQGEEPTSSTASSLHFVTQLSATQVYKTGRMDTG